MTFLPGFECDLFISYSHVDNEALTEGQKGWIDAFHRALQRRLAMVLTSDPVVFRDPKLQGNDFFAEVLKTKLRRTAILISVVSPRYLQSEWCLEELRVFVDGAEATGGLRVGDKARIFKVVKYPVEDSGSRLPEFRDLLGYEFFTYDPETGVPRELSPYMDDRARLGFIQKVDDLAFHIRELLKTFPDQESTVVRRVVPPSGSTVYLAETSYDLRDERDTVRRELEQRGHRVLPDVTLPHGPEFREVVRDQLGRAGLSVHLVGGGYGVVPETETESTVALQIELAGERFGSKGSSRIVWIPDGLEPRDERQARLIERLKTDATAQLGTELLETGLEELKTTINDVLRRRREEAPASGDGAAGADEPTRVFLVCDPADREDLFPLQDALFERQLEVLLPATEGDEAEIRADYQENLLFCDAVLVYWGRASDAWLNAQLRELRKAPGYGRDRPMLGRAVYIAPPASPIKDHFRSRELDVLRGVEGFRPAILDPFLDGIARARGGGG